MKIGDRVKFAVMNGGQEEGVLVSVERYLGFVNAMALVRLDGGTQTMVLPYMLREAFEDTICTCGHWYEEHNVQEQVCAGCDAAGLEDDLIDHAFAYDAEASTPEAIVDRGGDPDLWPRRVKEYFR